MSAINIYDLLVARATTAIEVLGTSGRPVQSSEIKQWVGDNHPADLSVLEKSWTTYLPAAAKDPANRIGRQPSGYGYVLLDEVVDVAGEEGECTETLPAEPSAEAEGGAEAQKGKNQKREAQLYSVLRDWLRGAGYRAEETANTKTGGAWGNPDLTGLRVVEGFLCQKDLEVATIEAKVSLNNWKREFFEAVSHKRFAHRAYFAFAVGSDRPTIDAIQAATELRVYGEKFRVGVLVVFMPVATYAALATGSDLPDLASDEVRVEELWPALHDAPEPQTGVDFLGSVLRIKDDNDLYAFGAV